MKLRIGSRKSDLARIQAYAVGNAIKAAHPEVEIQYSFKESLGDINLTDPLWKMPEKGVFTEDFVEDLKQNRVDIVVHSWKDLPTAPRPGLEIIATLPRADARDVFLLKNSRWPMAVQKDTIRILSSSPRREYNLKPFFRWALPHPFSQVEFLPVRGNVQTRIKKLLEQEVDGLIVAKAALDRLLSADASEFAASKSILRQYLSDLKFMVLPLEANPTAAAQGALAIECLSNRSDLKNIFNKVNCATTKSLVEEERKVLASHGGGCHQKIGISVQQLSHTSLMTLKGLTDTGVLLNERKILEGNDSDASKQLSNAKKLASPEHYFPHQLSEMDWFERSALPNQFAATQKIEQEHGYYVSKANALPDDAPFDFANSYLWTAGLETWRKLARRGQWVHGSSEGLGEMELAPRIDIIAGKRIPWIKFTHKDSKATGTMTALATYQLQVKADKIPDLSQKTYLYWPSYSHFASATERYPQLLRAQHFSGPGHTKNLIEAKTGSKVHVCLSFDDFLKKF